MKKKVLSAVLATTMVAGMMGNVVSVSAEEKYDLTLYSVNTTDPDFDDWLANVEEAMLLQLRQIQTHVSRRLQRFFLQEILP